MKIILAQVTNGQEILSENLENKIPLPRITENAIPKTIEKLNRNVTEKYVFLNILKYYITFF